MIDPILKTVYIFGIIIEIIIRIPYDRARRRNQITASRVTRQEHVLLGLFFLGMFLIPVIYIFTPWLAFADYELPRWAGWAGVMIFGVALWLFWKSHIDLGRNWSPSLQIREAHTLVTQGVYRYIRHPMYASQWVWSIAQILLLQNWLAGPCGLLLFIPLYFLRVPQEEAMMIEQFGEAYRAYMRRTGRIFPRFLR